jgi:hypothetical protein
MTMLNGEHDFGHERMLKKTKRPEMALRPVHSGGFFMASSYPIFCQ